jgi:hypothetical protein
VLDKDVAYGVRVVLTSVDLLVDCPSQRLSELGADFTHPSNGLSSILSIIRKDYRNKVLAREYFEVVEDFLDELLLLLVVGAFGGRLRVGFPKQ